MRRKLKPITPGEILLEEFLKPLGISQSKIARDLHLPVERFTEVVRGERAITSDTALGLALHFHTTPEFWMNLQSQYDLKLANRNLPPMNGRSSRQVCA